MWPIQRCAWRWRRRGRSRDIKQEQMERSTIPETTLYIKRGQMERDLLLCAQKKILSIESLMCQPSSRQTTPLRVACQDDHKVYGSRGATFHAAGLAATFVANYVTKAGQPARWCTSCCRCFSPPSRPPRAAVSSQLLAYKSQRAEAAKVKREHEMKAEWKAIKKEEAQAGKE
jgi:hypothetical protein